MLRKIIAGIVVAGSLSAPAQAQNTPANASSWWNARFQDSQRPADPGERFWDRVFRIEGSGANPWGMYDATTRNSSFYFRFGGGYSFNGDMTASGVPGVTFSIQDSGAAIFGMGVRVMPVLRVEVQASGTLTVRIRDSFAGLSGNFANARSAQIFGNVYLDLGPLIGTPFSLNPFIGGGVGVGFNSISYGSTFPGDVNFDHTHIAFAANATAGLQWQPMNGLILELAYRFLHTGAFRDNPAEPGAFRFTSPDAHQVMFSVLVPMDGLRSAFSR